ncbi:MAG: NUDIX domain-containing protein [Pseudomonadota bacterium]
MTIDLFPYQPQDFEITACENVYEGYFILQKLKLRFKTFAGPWSPIVTREYFKRPYAVAVLLFDAKLDRVVLVQQFRLGLYEDNSQSPWVIECVAGMLDNHSSPEDNAKRETLEETGLIIKKLLPVYNFWTSPGVCNEKVHLFCGIIDATNAQGLHGLASEAEDIRVINLSFQEALDLIDQGHINNAYTLIALQWLQINHSKLLTKVT